MVADLVRRLSCFSSVCTHVCFSVFVLFPRIYIDEACDSPVLLEILNRVPTTEVLRPFAPDLLKLCMHLLHSDDENNAVIALHIILDLHKTYRAQRPQQGPLEPDVQPFLDFVKQVNTLR